MNKEKNKMENQTYAISLKNQINSKPKKEK